MHTLKTSKARENILSRIRKGLSEHSAPMPFPEVDKQDIQTGFAHPDMSAEEAFADNFINLGGKFVFCENEQDVIDNLLALYDSRMWKQLMCAEPRLLRLLQNSRLDIAISAEQHINDADACVTGCEMLIGRTGSVILSSKQFMGRTAPVFYPVHIIIAYANQVAYDISDGIEAMKAKYGNQLPSMINLNTGPSRTADIEKTLVVGVHGPGEVLCFFVNQTKKYAEN
jgi:L-lactate dehydrogenase complex protein LldG